MCSVADFVKPYAGASTGGEPTHVHRLANISDTTESALRLRGFIKSKGDIEFSLPPLVPAPIAVSRAKDGLSVADSEHFAEWRGLFTVVSEDLPEVRAALERGENFIAVGAQPMSIRKCIRADVRAFGGSELEVHWGPRNPRKRRGPIRHGSICPRGSSAKLGAYEPPSPPGMPHATAVYQDLLDRSHIWEPCCYLVAAPPAAFDALLRGDDRESCEDGMATTIRVAMQVYASSSTDEDYADKAFTLAAQLEAALPSVDDVIAYCRLNQDACDTVIKALQYGIDVSIMDADVYDCMDALEQISSAVIGVPSIGGSGKNVTYFLEHVCMLLHLNFHDLQSYMLCTLRPSPLSATQCHRSRRRLWPSTSP